MCNINEKELDTLSDLCQSVLFGLACGDGGLIISDLMGVAAFPVLIRRVPNADNFMMANVTPALVHIYSVPFYSCDYCSFQFQSYCSISWYGR